jgi:hypothetical protein
MKKLIFLFLIIFTLKIAFSIDVMPPGIQDPYQGIGSQEPNEEDQTSDPFYSILNFFKEPIYSSLRCGAGAKSATEQIFRCIFDILELLKSFAIILMVIAFFGAAIYLITTPFFGLKNVATAWKILTWTPVGIVIVLLGDLIKDQIERIIFGP